MSRLLGVHLGGWILASVAFYAVGMVWYGMVFADAWMAAKGLTEADFADSDGKWMMLGMVIPFIVTFGLAKVMAMGEAVDLVGSLKRVFVLWVAFAMTGVMYELVYSVENSVPLFLINAGHSLVGWLVAAVILHKMS